MMEETYSCEAHRNAVLVASGNNIVVTHASACFSNPLHTALVSTLDVVAEWEERITSEARNHD